MEILFAIGGVVAILMLAMSKTGDAIASAIPGGAPDVVPDNVDAGPDPGGTSGADPNLANPNADIQNVTGSGAGLQIVNYTTDDVIAKAIPIIQAFEGCSLKAYPDPPGSGKFSIGWGHQIRPGDPYNSASVIGQSEADAILRIDVVSAYTCVTQNVQVDLTLNQAAALTSLTYNIGCPHFKGSTLLRDLNNGDIPGAQSEFAAWINSGGAVNPTLISRRVQEETLFAG